MTRRERFIRETEQALTKALRTATVRTSPAFGEILGNDGRPIEHLEELLIPGEMIVRETDGLLEALGALRQRRS